MNTINSLDLRRFIKSLYLSLHRVLFSSYVGITPFYRKFSLFLSKLPNLRSMAILWNFHPFGRRSQKNFTDTVSPFEKLNLFSGIKCLVLTDCVFSELASISAIDGRGNQEIA